jgi:hypothetical protein
MGTTFKSWLVANLETTTGVILSVICIPLLVISVGKYTPVEGDSKDVGSIFGIFAILLAIPFALGSTPPRLAKSIFIYLLILGIGILFFFFKDDKTGELIAPTWFPLAYLSAFVVISAVSFFIARYAKYNFHEVVSRRMLYRNSNVSLFEIEWRYVIDRFCIATFCILDAIVTIAVLIGFLSLI